VSIGESLAKEEAENMKTFVAELLKAGETLNVSSCVSVSSM